VQCIARQTAAYYVGTAASSTLRFQSLEILTQCLFNALMIAAAGSDVCVMI